MTSLAVTMSGLCSCGHTDRRHDNDGLCLADECECTGIKVNQADTALIIEPAPAPVVVEKKGTLDALLAEAKRSPFKRTANLAEKIDGLLDDLRERLDAESADAEAMREIAALEAKLAAARARLGRGPAKAAQSDNAGRGPARGEFACEDCGKVSPTAQGLSAHRRFNHPERAA